MRISPLLFRFYVTLFLRGNPHVTTIARHLSLCIEARGQDGSRINAWNYLNGWRLLKFVRQNPWFARLLAKGLDHLQYGTEEAKPIETSGLVTPRARIDKPWGWELIGATIRQGGEGYTEKFLIIVGPLSAQIHEDYTAADGAPRAAKTETQTSLGPDPYLLRIGQGNDAKVIELKPGECFHIHRGTWHQPSVHPNHVVIIKETSKPHIGPGSTTRGEDPWADIRSEKDI